MFDDVLSGIEENKDRWQIKVDLINNCGLEEKKGIIIGDTDTEIIAAKKLGFESIAVTNGIRNKSFLTDTKNICSNINEIFEFIK